MKKYDDMSKRYTVYERNMLENKKTLLEKETETEEAIAAIEQLQGRAATATETDGDGVETMYEIANNVYGHASIELNGKVCLWLGADVMVEYTYDEALTILKETMTTIEENKGQLEEALAFVKKQLTVCEVSLARLHNYGVQEKKKKKQEQDKQDKAA